VASSHILAPAGVIARIAAMHPPTMDFPVTLIHKHLNAKETATLLVAKSTGL
jgi:glucosamine-6-phosphate deaminase